MKNIIAILLAFTSLANAGDDFPEREGGSGVGGGDDVIILNDKSVRLADDFVASLQSNRRSASKSKTPNLPQNVIQILSLADNLFRAYGAEAMRDPIEAVKTDFIGNYVLSKEIEYTFTNKLPQISACQADGQYVIQLKQGEEKRRIACTAGNTTWFLKKYISQLSATDFARLIIHERLHAYPDYQRIGSEKRHFFIREVTRGLGELFTLDSLQAQGKRPILSAAQVANLEEMRRAFVYTSLSWNWYPIALETRLDFLNSHFISAQGGGLISQKSKNTISNNVYIGVGSKITGSIAITGHATLIHSALIGLHENSQNRSAITDELNLDHSILDLSAAEQNIEIERNVTIRNSFVLVRNLTLKSLAVIENSTVALNGLKMNASSKISNIRISGTGGTILDYDPSLSPGSLELGQNAAIRSGERTSTMGTSEFWPLITKNNLTNRTPTTDEQIRVIVVANSDLDFSSQDSVCLDHKKPFMVVDRMVEIAEIKDLQAFCTARWWERK